MASAPRRVRLARHVAVACVLVLTAVSCSSGNDESSDAKGPAGPDSKSTEGDRQTGGTGEPYEGYGGYESGNYDGTTNWICHPELPTDQCGDLDSTVVDAEGRRAPAPVEQVDDPPIDCFYAYPTTSSDPAPNADFDVDASEIDTVRAQVARYSQVCRVFAPAYRQVPLVGVATRDPEARKLAYDDVLDAWKTYMTQQNDGRGVVLIGHSQGAGILSQIMAEEMDNDAKLRSYLVSAILIGTTVSVPEGKDVGGDFTEIPACRDADSTGCVISFVSYPADRPPTESAGSIFGRVGEEGERALCVNPVELAGGNELADAVLPTKPSLLGAAGNATDVETPFVTLPGVLKAECTESGPYTYLAFAPAGDDDARDQSRLLTETLGPTWGLHLLDANLPQGDLIEVVEAQARAFTK